MRPVFNRFCLNLSEISSAEGVWLAFGRVRIQPLLSHYMEAIKIKMKAKLHIILRSNL